MLFPFATKKKSAHEFTGKNLFRNGLRVKRGPTKRELVRNAYLLLEGFDWPAFSLLTFMTVRNEFLGKVNFDHPGGRVGADGHLLSVSDFSFQNLTKRLL